MIFPSQRISPDRQGIDSKVWNYREFGTSARPFTSSSIFLGSAAEGSEFQLGDDFLSRQQAIFNRDSDGTVGSNSPLSVTNSITTLLGVNAELNCHFFAECRCPSINELLFLAPDTIGGRAG
jgi:hypothetical protein